MLKSAGYIAGAHVLNLVARAFLFESDPDAFEPEDVANTVSDREQQRLKASRKKGPRASRQRKEHFKSISLPAIDEIDGLLVGHEARGLGVIKNNTTH